MKQITYHIRRVVEYSDFFVGEKLILVLFFEQGRKPSEEMPATMIRRFSFYKDC
jgi:hypothetical protein